MEESRAAKSRAFVYLLWASSPGVSLYFEGAYSKYLYENFDEDFSSYEGLIKTIKLGVHSIKIKFEDLGPNKSKLLKALIRSKNLPKWVRNVSKNHDFIFDENKRIFHEMSDENESYLHSFVWEKTPEGHDYWADFYSSL